MNKKQDEFRYDPEAEEKSNKYRLPFALCKAKGIQIQNWWTPRHAWEALKNGGYIDNVSDEYADYFRNLKKQAARKSRERNKLRNTIRNAQRKDPEHNPDRDYRHKDGAIDGADKGMPMNFEQADSGNVNPFFGSGKIGYRTNCQTCVATYVARRQGYDVRALPNLDNRKIYELSSNPMLAYIDDYGKHPSETHKARHQRTDMFLENNVSENRIYTVSCMWRGENAGHIVTAERVNGSVRVYDPQTNKTYQGKQISAFFNGGTMVRLADLTGFKVDERFCDHIMKRSKK